MVPKGGLEPPRVAPHAPQTCASANSATSAPARSQYAVDARTLSIRSGRDRVEAARIARIGPSAPDADHPPDPRLAQPRVESIADPLAEQVVREDRDQDGEPGIERHPPCDLDRILAVVQDVAPGRIR